jgi:hypothetical protein
MGPETANGNMALWQALVCEQKPGPKDALGKNVKNSECDNFTVNSQVTGSSGDGPDYWVRNPDDESVSGNQGIEAGDIIAFGTSRRDTID